MVSATCSAMPFRSFLLIILESAIHVLGNFSLIFLTIFFALFNSFYPLVRPFVPAPVTTWLRHQFHPKFFHCLLQVVTCGYAPTFSIRVFSYRHWQFTGQQEKGGTMPNFSLPLPPTSEHSDIYLQLFIWDDYHVFLTASLITTRVLLDKFFHLIVELSFWSIDYTMLVSVSLIYDLILDFCYCSLSLETDGIKLTLTITLVVHANRLTK